jgi:two-component system cell cycle sensor histidine kinase/response regulator CckA
VTHEVGPRHEVGVCLLDASGVVLELDADFARLTELSETAVGGVKLSELLPWSPPLSEREPTFSCQRRGEELVELICRQVSSGQRVSCGPVVYTVTAQRIASESSLAQQLRVARQTLDLVIEASPLAITTLDRDKRVVMWNRASERMFGWTREEVLGKPYPLVPEGKRESFEQLFDQVVLQGVGYTGVDSIRQRKDGSDIEVRMHAAALRDAHGHAVGGMALLEDRSETRGLEQRVRQSQKLEAVGRLAGGIAHDFNNLLAVILGTTDLLSLEAGLSANALEYIAEIQQVSSSARELVAQLMTFSRRSVVRPEVFDVNEQLHASTKLLSRLINDRVELELEFAERRAWVRMDPTQFEQVLINLAVNASDAMPNGGRLSYATAIVELRAGPNRPSEPAYHVCIEVHDTGTGIAPDVLPQVFEPFFTTKAAGKGTGLGLANVYGIVRQAGGDIEVESSLGRGTSFRVYLPLASEPAAREPSGPRAAGLSRGSEHVLLVEDNESVRASTAKLLAALGYQVTTAVDGIDALERIADGAKIDLVLTDLMMPRLGGAELAAQLGERFPALPVICMSGNLDVDELRTQVEQGHMRFLQKPVALRELALATRAALEGE